MKDNSIVINGRVFHVPDRLDPRETSAFVSSAYHARQRAEADIGDIELHSRFMIPMPSHIIYKKANRTILGYKGDHCVLKVTRCDSEEQFEHAVTERNCMEALSSCSDVSLKVLDSMVDEEHKTVYIKMEKVRTLKEALSKGKLQLSDALKIAESICDALITLRDKLGIYHNDISLSNCYYKKGKVKLGDFDNAIPVNASSDRIAGTVKYMAPETYNSHIHDERSEIYSAMMLIYVMLNQGYAAFEQELGYDAATETRMQGAGELPVPAELGTVPEAYNELVWLFLKRGCANDPDERYQTFEEMRDQAISLLMYVSETGEDKYNFRLNSSNYNPSEATTELLTERF